MIKILDELTSNKESNRSSSFITENACINLVQLESKKKRLSGDEKLCRDRERNKIHARKTRERKKTQAIALQLRIMELQKEGSHLRQVIDERYTASSLLGLRDSLDLQSGELVSIKSSSNISSNVYESFVAENLNAIPDTSSENNQQPTKRVRRRGRYDPQERDRIRRERNRIHAKKTRDKKKHFFESSENIIDEMVNELNLLRDYLVSINMMTEEERSQARERDVEAKKELTKLKMNELEFGDQSEEDNQSQSEKLSSWSGSSHVDYYCIENTSREEDSEDKESKDNESSSSNYKQETLSAINLSNNSNNINSNNINSNKALHENNTENETNLTDDSESTECDVDYENMFNHHESYNHGKILKK